MGYRVIRRIEYGYPKFIWFINNLNMSSGGTTCHVHGKEKSAKICRKLNKQRKKQGLTSYQGSAINDKHDVFKGRKYVLPLVLVALAGLYALLGTATSQAAGGSNDVLNWVVSACISCWRS
ncbi:Uncharacterised protein [Actinobacillus pleuropneumoniae]|nr:Uncharacterised protein [Actinobacillus pleuropneumoniae]